jgi:hypothetical protein
LPAVAAGTALVVGGATAGALGGYYLSKPTASEPTATASEPTVNTCTCRNGKQKTGAACTENNASMCESCDADFNMNAAQSECYGPVDIVIDLGSSKSKINVIELKEKNTRIDRLVNLKQWYPRSFKKGKKPEEIESPNGGGLAGACVGAAKYELEGCMRHILRLKRALDNVREEVTENNILSVSFLGTAGFRQANKQCKASSGAVPASRTCTPGGGKGYGWATLELLQRTMEREEFWKSIQSNYSILQGVDEAKNEFIALKEAKNSTQNGHYDKTGVDELIGMIAIGGASLQYAVEIGTSSSPSLNSGFIEGGLDVAGKLYSGDECEPENADPLANRVDQCSRVISQKTTGHVDFNNKLVRAAAEFVTDGNLKLYVLGGMYYSMRDFALDPDGPVYDVDIAHMKRMATSLCKEYVFDKDSTNKYKKHQCFRMNYFIHVFKSLSIPDTTKIHFRKKIDGKKVEWAKATRMLERNTEELPAEFIR